VFEVDKCEVCQRLPVSTLVKVDDESVPSCAMCASRYSVYYTEDYWNRTVPSLVLAEGDERPYTQIRFGPICYIVLTKEHKKPYTEEETRIHNSAQAQLKGEQ
jgi:hypothetical protein